MQGVKMTRTLLTRRRVLSGAAALSAATILPRSSLADWRPTETIRVIAPAAAGGSTDVMGRLLAAHLQSVWGQSAVVENRSGGGGTIGTSEVIRQKGDGHTILISNPGPNAIAYSIFRNLNYRADQLQAVSNMIRIPNIVSAHPATGIKSIAELIAFLKANPDKLNYASSGVGQSPHLTGAWFLQLTGLKMTHVPFRGAGPALQAALAADIQILFDVSSWFGVMVPKACPPEIVNALNLQVKAMLEREEIRKNIAAMGARADYGTPDQFAAFLDAETK